MRKIYVIVLLISVALCFGNFSTSFAQNNYFVSKDGSGDFTTINQVNNTSLKPGDIVSFKSGEQFSDAVLECKTGITYNTYGGTAKAIIGDSLTAHPDDRTYKPTIYVATENVTIDNLHIYTYSNGENAIWYKVGGLTVSNCTLTGGLNAHNNSHTGIYSGTYNLTKKILITKNVIHDFGNGTILTAPNDLEMSYNEVYNIYRYTGYKSHGGMGFKFQGGFHDTKYGLHIHHNEFYNFEHTAMYLGSLSRGLVEYNYIHDNLDDRLFMGGMSHGNISKFYDNTTAGYSLGNIFRYNYIENLRTYGEFGYTYTQGTPAQIEAGTILSSAGDPNYRTYIANGNTYEIASKSGVLGGGGYGNLWIHNNVFANIDAQIFAKGKSIDPDGSTVDPVLEYASYFVNNTIYKGGKKNVNNGLIWTFNYHGTPMHIYNNIVDMAKLDNNAAIYLKYDLDSVDYNLIPNLSKIKLSGENVSDVGYAIWVRDDQYPFIGNSNRLATDPNWVDTTSTVFVENIGISGVYMPNLSLVSGGNANDKGKPYDEIGDTYTDGAGITHELGKDPTGRSFAYDILGNLRTTNDIGAVGTAEGNPIVDPPPNSSSSKPVINIHPVNISTNLGDDVTFTVSAESEDEIGYQWWKHPYVNQSESKIVNNEKYSGATTNTLTIKNVTSDDSNVKYLCEVYNKKDHSNLWVNSNPASIIIQNTQNSDPATDLKVFLEAPYNNSNMETNLGSSGILSKTQPYNIEPWNYNNSETIDEIKSNYVDWLLIELRNEMNQISYRKAGILTNEGTVINSDGKQFSFNDIIPGEYYIAVIHRNHLDIMSPVKIKVEENKPVLYNFTDLISKAYGKNAMTDLGGGNFGMYAGDADANGIINNLDFGKVANSIPNKGYYNMDLDMNGVINVLDYNKINKNILKHSYVN